MGQTASTSTERLPVQVPSKRRDCSRRRGWVPAWQAIWVPPASPVLCPGLAGQFCRRCHPPRPRAGAPPSVLGTNSPEAHRGSPQHAIGTPKPNAKQSEDASHHSHCATFPGGSPALGPAGAKRGGHTGAGRAGQHPCRPGHPALSRKAGLDRMGVVSPPSHQTRPHVYLVSLLQGSFFN